MGYKTMNIRWRKWRGGWRNTLILINEFKSPLLFFTVTVIGGGFAYYVLSQAAGEPVKTLGEAVFTILAATVLQPINEFQKNIILQLFHFAMPLIGIIFLAQGFTDFGILLFNRKSQGRSGRWLSIYHELTYCTGRAWSFGLSCGRKTKRDG